MNRLFVSRISPLKRFGSTLLGALRVFRPLLGSFDLFGVSNKDHVKINDLFCPPVGLVPVRLPVELSVSIIMFVLVGLSINQSPLECKNSYFKMCLLEVIFILLM